MTSVTSFVFLNLATLYETSVQFRMKFVARGGNTGRYKRLNIYLVKKSNFYPYS